MRNILVTLALAILVGCGHPGGVMVPVASSSPSSSKVDMLVVTTRQPSGDPATLFEGERSATPQVTDISVSIPKQRQAGTIQWPKSLPADPRTDFAVTRVRSIADHAQAKSWFHTYTHGGHVLVFVHGFNNKYEDSVFRLAQIVHDSGMNATPVLFTWPSRAELTGYEYDKESTNYSRTELERTLRLLAEDPAVKDVTLLAHSMGTWLAMEALRQMGIRDGGVNRKISDVILASPDIDIQVFAKQYVEMGPAKPRMTIFVSQDDRALAVSSFITGNVARLGSIDPSKEPYASRLQAAGVTAIDLTKVKTEDGLHHGKFAESPQIVQLIGQHIMAGRPLTDSSISVGEGVAAVVGGSVRTVGTVAGVTVSAPLRVIEGARPPKPSEIHDTLVNDNDSILKKPGST